LATETQTPPRSGSANGDYLQAVGGRIFSADANGDEIDDLTVLFSQAMSPDGNVTIQACNSANSPGVTAGGPEDTGEGSIVHEMSRLIPSRTITGFKSLVRFVPYTRLYWYGRQRSFMNGHITPNP
jgi:hypothetical protein